MKALTLLLSLLLCYSAQAKRNTFEMSPEEFENGVVVVPAGNMGGEQRDYNEGDYSNAINIITKKENICVIKQAAELYQVDPIGVMGSIVGEHTFNVNIWDIGQDNYVYMVGKWTARFAGNGIDLSQMLKEEKYAKCADQASTDFDLWYCYNATWKKDSRGNGKDLKWTFFDPMGAGFTYGFGQLGPERALQVTDLVNEISGFDKVTVDDPRALYDTVLNPQTSIHYVAASNRISIDIYKRDAHFDISQNIGLIATLYNIGKERDKASESYAKTMAALKKNGVAEYPGTNYYGWFINHKADELRAYYEQAIRQCD